MALINFPTSPLVGASYVFEAGTDRELSFIFKAGAIGAVDGYWSDNNITHLNAANATEINVGTVNNKYIAPDQLALSHYIKATGGVMTGYLKGVNPATSADFATKGYADIPPNIYEEEDTTTASTTFNIAVTTKGKGLIDFTAHVNSSGIYDNTPGHDIAATVYLQVYDAANTTLIHDMPLTKSSSNSSGHGQWPTATVRLLKVLSPDTSYVIRVTKTHGYNPSSGYTRIIGVAS